MCSSTIIKQYRQFCLHALLYIHACIYECVWFLSMENASFIANLRVSGAAVCPSPNLCNYTRWQVCTKQWHVYVCMCVCAKMSANARVKLVNKVNRQLWVRIYLRDWDCAGLSLWLHALTQALICSSLVVSVKNKIKNSW